MKFVFDHWVYLEHSVLNLLLHVWFLKSNKMILFLGFSKCGCLSCSFNIAADIENFVQISILWNKTKIVEIWTIFFISVVNKATTFWKCLNWNMTINSPISLLKFGLWIKCRKLFQRPKTTSICLATVMFGVTVWMYLHPFVVSILYLSKSSFRAFYIILRMISVKNRQFHGFTLIHWNLNLFWYFSLCPFSDPSNRLFFIKVAAQCK